MGSKTSIEWTADKDGNPGSTWNPIRALNRETGKVGWFCVHESEGCRFCYAESINHRLGTGIDFKAQNRDKIEIFLDEKILLQPLRWRRPRKIFPNSMTDWMADFVPDEWRDRMMAVMALCPQHTFLPLTKRAARQRDYAGAFGTPGRIGRHLHALAEEAKGCAFTLWRAQERLIDWPLPNVWAGVSVEDQPRWDERWPALAATPAAVRWVSYEPALGPLSIDALGGPDWLVCGGESGPGARPMHPEWTRSIRDQCQAAGVPFFFKQWGHFGNEGDQRNCVVQERGGNTANASRPYGLGLFLREGQTLRYPVGKKAAGRLLDGREWSEYPAQERA